MKSKPTVQQQLEIYEAIRSGEAMPSLLERFRLDHVVATLERANLRVTPDDLIVRADMDPDTAVPVALRSSVNKHIATKAHVAYTKLLELSQILAKGDAERAGTALRQAQIDAVSEWIKWLGNARQQANEELRRLNPRTKPRSPRAMREAG